MASSVPPEHEKSGGRSYARRGNGNGGAVTNNYINARYSHIGVERIMSRLALAEAQRPNPVAPMKFKSEAAETDPLIASMAVAASPRRG